MVRDPKPVPIAERAFGHFFWEAKSAFMKLLIFRMSLLFLIFPIFSIAQNKPQATKDGFIFNPNEAHGFLIVLSKRFADLAEMRTDVTKYTWTYFAKDKLEVSQIRIGWKNLYENAMYIEGFREMEHAMKYFDSLKKNRPDFLQMGMTLDYFAVSKTNFDQILRNKSLLGYKEFFERYYLK